MIHEELQALIGRALIDPIFEHGLLNGQREVCLAEFPLSLAEAQAAREIQADDLQAYAQQLHGWVQRHDRVLPLRTIRMGTAVPLMVAA